MPPKKVDWAAEAADTAQAFSKGKVQPIGPTGGSASDDDRLRSQLKRLQSFWRAHGAGFTDWWNELPISERGDFLRATIPALPPHRGSTQALVGSEVQDARGVALLVPELNAADLTEQGGQRGLLKLIEQRVEQAQHADELKAAGSKDAIIDELDWADCQLATALLEAKLVRPLPGGPPPGSFVVLCGDMAGRVFAVGSTPEARAQVAAMRARLQGRGIMDADPFLLARQRQACLLSALVALADSYLMDVLGREAPSRSIKAAGCSQSGAHQGKEGGVLLWCPCQWACYCSRECQRLAWPQHKGDCAQIRAQRKQAQQQTEQEGRQQAGAPSGEASSSAAAGSSSKAAAS